MTKLQDLKKRWMEEPEFAQAYAQADADYRIIEELIAARMRARLSQSEVAHRMGTTQSAIARLEGGTVSPSLSTIRRYAAATGSRLRLFMEVQESS
jgi:transcriptional regulator with XRE-family HTH domain